MRIVALLAAVFAISAHAQQVYKWVDEKGAVHYGEQPPPQAKTQKLNVPPPSEAAPAAKPAATEKKDAAPAGDNAARCAKEKEQLRVLEADAEVNYKNAKGEIQALEPEKREAAKASVRQLVKKYCA